MLDEIDKMGHDFRGDPASALLEVLDPEQNGTFNDHYLEVDYDLSNVMFITTANTLNMPQPADGPDGDHAPLRLHGGREGRDFASASAAETDGEPRPQEASSTIEDAAMREMIRIYTREAGVRNLERELARLCRKAVTQDRQGRNGVGGGDAAEDLAGHARRAAVQIRACAEERDQVGVTTGLAWTEVGGDLLSIEAVHAARQGPHEDHRQAWRRDEGVRSTAATSYVRANAPRLGVKPPVFETIDIHVHVPEGATPKDGPSAGIAMVTSIVSVLTGIPCVAMWR